MFQITPHPSSPSLTIVLDLPPKQLSPNFTVGSTRGRLHKSRVIKNYRRDAREAAEVACASAIIDTMPWRAAVVQATFYHKDQRRRDRDNLLASLKAAFDGIRDAGVLLDDDELIHLPPVRERDKETPRVEITLWEIPDNEERLW